MDHVHRKHKGWVKTICIKSPKYSNTFSVIVKFCKSKVHLKAYYRKPFTTKKNQVNCKFSFNFEVVHAFPDWG